MAVVGPALIGSQPVVPSEDAQDHGFDDGDPFMVDAHPGEGDVLGVDADDRVLAEQAATKRQKVEHSSSSDVMASTIQSVAGGKLADPLLKRVTLVAKKLQDDMYKLTQAKKRKEKIVGDFDALCAGRYPPGVRPFKCIEDKLLDRIDYANNDKVLSVSIPAGKSLREAKMMIHLATTKWMKEIDKISITSSVSELSEAVQYKVFEKKRFGYLNQKTENS